MDAREKLDALERICAALAHSARRQMLLAVQLRGEMTAGDIAARFDHAWPTTTGHLTALVGAGLLRVERRGRNRVYQVDGSRLRLLSEWLAWFEPAAAGRPRAKHG